MLTAPAGPRFAIYFVPAADSALYRFGAAVLGYDCYTGETVARSLGACSGKSLPQRKRGVDTGYPKRTCANAIEAEADWAALTAEPRRYGFHATLKAPFRLRDDYHEANLVAQMRALAASVVDPPRIEPVVDLIAGFVAIVPRAPSSALDRLAADCVTRLDGFRAPMAAEDKARRAAAGLGVAQIAHLERWGYPYVLDEFRFHMTLTGRIAADRRAAIHAHLREAFAKACGSHPIVLDRLTLVRQDNPDAPFRVVAQTTPSPVPGAAHK